MQRRLDLPVIRGGREITPKVAVSNRRSTAEGLDPPAPRWAMRTMSRFPELWQSGAARRRPALSMDPEEQAVS
jgi:hypothetical protein